MTEAAFQKMVITLARLCGWRVYHTYDSRRSQAGFPDLVLIRGQLLLFVELKTDTGRVTAEQKAWLAALAEAGQDVWVWRPADWPAIEAILARENP